MIKFNQFITEAFDKPYRYDFAKEPDGSYYGYFKASDGKVVTVSIESTTISVKSQLKRTWNVEFSRDGKQSVTGEGDAMRIFATVIKIIEDFIKKESPEMLMFSALKENEDKKEKQSREKLYSRMVKRFASKMGYKSSEKSFSGGTEWHLTRKK